MWSIGRYDLGLSEDGFWDLTYSQLDALLKRKRLNDRRSELILAQIAGMYHNVHRDEKSPARTVEDFMTTKAVDCPGEKRKKQTAEEMKKMAKLITSAFGGTFK